LFKSGGDGGIGWGGGDGLAGWEQFLRGKKAGAKQSGGDGKAAEMSDKAGSDVHEISPYVETKIRLRPYA
jgi:hypothetical protein